MNMYKENFMNRFNFPGVIGAIDGTHIAILKPTTEEHNFINRKGFHSINVQVICNDKMKIMSVNANYPGSAHDAFIWRHSQIRDHLQNSYNAGNRNSWLIGDSGYPLEPFLLTPILNPQPNSPEARYNETHIRARLCVERCFGLLKMRFRCLLKERTARYDPQFVGKLFNACAILHNICLDHNFHIPVDDMIDINADDNIPAFRILPNQAPLLNEGRRVRENIVERYFA